MDTIIAILCVLCLLAYLKWILIGIVFPFQVLYGQIKKRWEKHDMPFICKILGAPYYLWEKLFRDGWQDICSFKSALFLPTIFGDLYIKHLVLR